MVACLLSRQGIVALSVTVLLTSCSFSARSIYNEHEIAVAEAAVSQFHKLHDQGNSEAIYDLMLKESHNDDERAKMLNEIKIFIESVGRVQERKLVEKKVYLNPGPGFTSQVKLAYDTTFEKSSCTELFAWNIRNSNEAVLVEYRTIPPS